MLKAQAAATTKGKRCPSAKQNKKEPLPPSPPPQENPTAQKNPKQKQTTNPLPSQNINRQSLPAKTDIQPPSKTNNNNKNTIRKKPLNPPPPQKKKEEERCPCAKTRRRYKRKHCVINSTPCIFVDIRHCGEGRRGGVGWGEGAMRRNLVRASQRQRKPHNWRRATSCSLQRMNARVSVSRSRHTPGYRFTGYLTLSSLNQ